MPNLEKMCVEKMNTILSKEYMSSEESEYEDVQQNGVATRKLKCYRVRRLPWERKKMRRMKERMDCAYLKSLNDHAKGMMKKRKDGEPSLRSCPTGPSWAVRAGNKENID